MKKVFQRLTRRVFQAFSFSFIMLGKLGKRIGEQPVEIGIGMRYLINHDIPMRIVDRMETLSNSRAEVSVEVSRDMPFVGEDGALDDAAYLELMAQSPGPLVSMDEYGRVRRVSEAYLVGARNIKVFGRAFAGEKLRISLKKKESYGELSLIEGSVRRGGDLLAEGEITLLVKK